ncbi:Dephospho-CoA kinase cab5 [Podospora pseudocomata]|uniref:Dephospho-CoA kinase n=2 Tax=Podospora TaxID=5144 RepID=A0A090CSI6_PODAN|nr:Dephospho-CoA kinase cab5 [Podospora pseudocomata]CDP32031.1 Putative protein of unknown function [Podospora anserina S mat+]
MLLIGLTGSIATGKSTVSSLLSQPPYNLPIIDADLIARQVVEPGTPGYNAIVKHFLPSTPDLLVPVSEDMPENGPNGKGRPLNRPALGKRVFGTSLERAKDRGVLNGIVHPAVRKAMFWAVVREYVKGKRAVVLDVPLLFESKLDRYVGRVMVVGVRDEEVQMERLMRRDGHLSREDAENRVRSQGGVMKKVERAAFGGGVVVWNDGDKDDLKRELRRVMEEVERGSPRWWGWVLWVCPPLALVVGGWGLWRNWRGEREWEERERRERAKL